MKMFLKNLLFFIVVFTALLVPAVFACGQDNSTGIVINLETQTNVEARGDEITNNNNGNIKTEDQRDRQLPDMAYVRLVIPGTPGALEFKETTALIPSADISKYQTYYEKEVLDKNIKLKKVNFYTEVREGIARILPDTEVGFSDGITVYENTRVLPDGYVFVSLAFLRSTSPDNIINSLDLRDWSALMGIKLGADAMLPVIEGREVLSDSQASSGGVSLGGSYINSNESGGWSPIFGYSRGSTTNEKIQRPFVYYVVGRLVSKELLAMLWVENKETFCGYVENGVPPRDYSINELHPDFTTWKSYIHFMAIDFWIRAMLNAKNCEPPLAIKNEVEDLLKVIAQASNPKSGVQGDGSAGTTAGTGKQVADTNSAEFKSNYDYLFEFGTAVFKPGQEEKLQANAEKAFLLEEKTKAEGGKIIVDTYCSKPGSPELNWGTLGPSRGWAIIQDINKRRPNGPLSDEELLKLYRIKTSGNLDPPIAPEEGQEYNELNQRGNFTYRPDAV